MIINFHPKELVSKKGLEVITNLNSEGAHEIFYSTDKTTEEWQTIIKSKEKLILVAPLYWWGASYEFDKWIQDILKYGFAYKYTESGMPEGLLAGRAFEMHMTHGTPTAYATKMLENVRERMTTGIFGFCGGKAEVTFYDLA